jgi:endonuclease V-like protein UPF0215 family
MRPHLLGIDDGPFVVGASRATPIVGVMTEGCDVVEAVAATSFPIDGDGVTAFLAEWIAGLRLRPAAQAIVIGGVTIAGLAVVDVAALADAAGLPVLAVSRRDPRRHRVADALRAAGLDDRLAVLARTPAAEPTAHGLYVACAGTTPAHARALVAASVGKAAVPEPLRLAHLIARAIATGESRGRV